MENPNTLEQAVLRDALHTSHLTCVVCLLQEARKEAHKEARQGEDLGWMALRHQVLPAWDPALGPDKRKFS